jgi:uncharacterized repeat protein (TIGR03803 family)
MLHAPNRRTPMPETPRLARHGVLALAALCAFAVLPASGGETVRHSFSGFRLDGKVPNGALIADVTGNVYGVTEYGGGRRDRPGNGTVFELEPDGSEFDLLHFQYGHDGAYPGGPLLPDNAGNLYGTVSSGGTRGCHDREYCGAVFKLAPDGTETVFYAFQNESDGVLPEGGVIADGQGNLYGVTAQGGVVADCHTHGCGTVFMLASDGTKRTLYAFTGSADGSTPGGGLIIDGEGNVYGTTASGGLMGGCGSNGHTGNGCGTVFEVTPGGTETVLHTFKGSDGGIPLGGVIADNAGNLYGTTSQGRGGNCSGGCGTVFKLAPDGTQTVLHAFKGGSDGEAPQAGLVMDGSGNLYGTTQQGGHVGKFSPHGCGTVFKIAPDGSETVLHAFKLRDGCAPTAALLAGANGLLYGTTPSGGADRRGVVFSVNE